MPDTIRTEAELLALFPDNTTGEISPQDIRDFVVSAKVDELDGKLSNDGGEITTDGVGGITAVQFTGDGGGVTNIDPANITGLHAVATTGSYDDLSNTPTLDFAIVAGVAAGDLLKSSDGLQGITSTGFLAPNQDLQTTSDVTFNGVSTVSLQLTNGNTLEPDGSFTVSNGVGTAGQVLTSNGAAPISWEDAGSGNPFNQELNTTDDVIFNGVSTAAASIDNAGAISGSSLSLLTPYNPFDQELNTTDDVNFNTIGVPGNITNLQANGSILLNATVGEAGQVATSQGDGLSAVWGDVPSPFDQSLNTTDSVEFAFLELNGGEFAYNDQGELVVGNTPGTEGQVLTSHGANFAAAWETPASLMMPTWVFDGQSTTMSGASAGEFRVNSGNHSVITQILFHNEDDGAMDWDSFFTELYLSGNSLIFFSNGDRSKRAVYQVTTASNNGTETVLTVSNLAYNDNVVWNDDKPIYIWFAFGGVNGAEGPQGDSIEGPQGAPGMDSEVPGPQGPQGADGVCPECP